MQDGDKKASTAPPEAPAEKPVEPPASQWQFKPEGGSAAQTPASAASSQENAVSWTASEFIAHDKATSWYIGLGVAAGLLAVLVYFLAHDWVSIIVIIIITTIFGVFAAREPRVLN